MEEEKKKTTPKKTTTKKTTGTAAKKSTGTATKKTTGAATKKTTTKKAATTTAKKTATKKPATGTTKKTTGTTTKKTSSTTAKKKTTTTKKTGTAAKKTTAAPKKEKVEEKKEVVAESVEVKPVEEIKKVEEVKPEVVETKKEEIKQEEVKQEPKFQKVTGKQKTKKSAGKKFLIFILILLILGICGLGVWAYFNQDKIPFLNKSQTNSQNNNENKKNEIKEWEKAYAKILMDENNYKDSKNYFIQLVSLDRNSKVPTLLVIYDNATAFSEKIIDVWQVDEDGDVLTNGAHYNVTDDGLKVLYNIEKEDYNWYIYHRDTNNEEYKKLSNLVNQVKEGSKLQGSKLISPNSSMQNYTVCTDGQSGNILKEDFEKQFIVVDTKNLSKTWVPFKSNLDETGVLELILNEENKNKNASSVVSEIKEELFKKADKIKAENKKVQENI